MKAVETVLVACAEVPDYPIHLWEEVPGFFLTPIVAAVNTLFPRDGRVI
jgi:hypothetical protein